MDQRTYHAYCKVRMRPYNIKPQYPRFGDSWWPPMCAGLILGLVIGIWKNFFPLPENVFRTVGAVMFTIVYCGAGAVMGLILTPLYHLGKILAILIRHHTAVSRRTRRLAQNEVVRQVLRCAGEMQICAILITAKGIRLYDRIPDGRYCDSENDTYVAFSRQDYEERQFTKQPHWLAYDQAFFQQFLFEDAGFADMDGETQIDLANYLRKQLKHWGIAHHRARAVWTEMSGGGWNGKLTFDPHSNTLTAGRYRTSVHEYTREFYSDFLVYSLENAYHASLEQTQTAPQQRNW